MVTLSLVIFLFWVSNIKGYLSSTQSLSDNLEKFWISEETIQSSVWSSEDKLCEQHFVETHSKLENGQFMVRLPLKLASSELGNSKRLALKRLLQLENRF